MPTDTATRSSATTTVSGSGTEGFPMRQIHVAGEKTFVDYSGKTPCICDPKTGERIEVELFVAAGRLESDLRRGD